MRPRHCRARSSPFDTFVPNAPRPRSFVALALLLVALRLHSRVATALVAIALSLAMSTTATEPDVPDAVGTAVVATAARSD